MRSGLGQIGMAEPNTVALGRGISLRGSTMGLAKRIEEDDEVALLDLERDLLRNGEYSTARVIERLREAVFGPRTEGPEPIEAKLVRLQQELDRYKDLVSRLLVES